MSKLTADAADQTFHMESFSSSWLLWYRHPAEWIWSAVFIVRFYYHRWLSQWSE